MLSPKNRAEQDNRLTLVAIIDLFDVLSGADAFSAALENTHSGISQGGADDWEEFGNNPDTFGARDTLH